MSRQGSHTGGYQPVTVLVTFQKHFVKTMLKYKCEHAGIDYQEIPEAFSTRSLPRT